MLRQADFYKKVDYNCLYFTIHEAVVIGKEILEKEAQVNSEYFNVLCLCLKAIYHRKCIL